MQVQWEVEVYCARVTCGLCLAAGLCPFLSLSKAFDGSFLGALFGAFLGALLGEFSFAFVFARDVEWRAICECMVPTGTHCSCELAGVCDMQWLVLRAFVLTLVFSVVASGCEVLQLDFYRFWRFYATGQQISGFYNNGVMV